MDGKLPRNPSDKQRKCVFETEIHGLYSHIQTIESNYHKLDLITAGIADLLEKWKK